MKATFNGYCWACKKFKPRCAKVRCSLGNPLAVKIIVLCEDCRKGAFRGKYHLTSRHK